MTISSGQELVSACSPGEGRTGSNAALQSAGSALSYFCQRPREPSCLVSFSLSSRPQAALFADADYSRVVSYEVTSPESNKSSGLLYYTRISSRVASITGLSYHRRLTKCKIFRPNISTLWVSINSLILFNFTVSCLSTLSSCYEQQRHSSLCTF